jgi:hypothetical protein
LPENGGPPGPAANYRRPEVPRQANRYVWLIGILAFMGIVVLLFTTSLPNAGKGVRGMEPGVRIPDFAAPLATSNLEGDANVCQRREQCNDQAGNVPACQVRSPAVFNVCDARRHPLVLSFVFDKGADCTPQIDRVQRMKDDVPGVDFAVIFYSQKKNTEIAELARRRGWTMPVAHTTDAAVTNLYGIGGCPTTIFVRHGGRALKTVLGPITEEDLRDTARSLLRPSWW